MEDITILLLAAGDSTRLWPLTDKHTLRFLAKPLIWYSLSQIVRMGGKHVVIVVNASNRKIIEQVAIEFPVLTITLVEQKKEPGMSGAIISASKFIDDNRVLIVGPSDIFDDYIWISFKKLLNQDPDSIIAGMAMSTYFPGGYLTIEDGKVTAIVEKPDPLKLPSRFVSFVFDYFKSPKNLISQLSSKKMDQDDLYERTINQMLEDGLRVQFLPYKGFWGYVKFPWHVLTLTGHFLGKIKGTTIKKAVVAKTATISGDVYIEDGVRVLDHASIVGPTYIGRGSLIGNNSLVRESMIGGHCVVGYSTEIVRSWIGEGCWFHSNYIGDSVVSDNVAFGAGAVTANFRLDEDIVYSTISGKKTGSGRVKMGSVIGENVRIGVNTSVMPGIKIGKNSSVAAGICLTSDVKDDSFCVLRESNFKILRNRHPVTKSTVRTTVLHNLTK